MDLNEFEGGLINRSAPDAMRCWSRMLGVSQSEVLIAVAVVGNRAERVRDYLAKPWPGHWPDEPRDPVRTEPRIA